jgi:predicted MFS family arabinose efflux permease
VALVSDWWQKEDRGFAVGVHHTGFPIGQLVGPVLIGAVLASAGWREAFLIIPAIGILIMLGQLWLGRRRNLVAVNGFIRDHDMTPSAEEDEHVSFVNPVRAVGTALSHRNTLLGATVAFLLILCEFGVANYLTTQLTDAPIGMSLSTAATISGASGLTGWIGQIVWGGLSDRIGRKKSMAVIVVGWVVTLAALTLISGLTSAILLLVFWGVFRNSPFPVLYALVIDSIPGVASAGMGVMIGVAIGLGQVFSALVSGPIIAHFGFDANYLTMAAIAALGIIPVLLMRETVARA